MSTTPSHDAPKTIHVTGPDAATDRDLIIALWRMTPDLPAPVHDRACDASYAESDGYGPVGYIPSQGHDWSGIRDSSPEAWGRMAAAARRVLTQRGITTFTCRPWGP